MSRTSRTSRARDLRRDSTPAERALWQAMRNRQLSDKVRRQVPFGPYILDFLFAMHGLAIEIDGDTHGTEEGLRHDARRDAFLAEQGIRTLRFANRDVFGNLEGVLISIIAALHHPHPDPLPQAGEGAPLPVETSGGGNACD